jgi:hypothetical protein
MLKRKSRRRLPRRGNLNKPKVEIAKLIQARRRQYLFPEEVGDQNRSLAAGTVVMMAEEKPKKEKSRFRSPSFPMSTHR